MGLLVEEATHTLLRFGNIVDEQLSTKRTRAWYLPLTYAPSPGRESPLARTPPGAGLAGYLMSAWMSNVPGLALSLELLQATSQALPDVASLASFDACAVGPERALHVRRRVALLLTHWYTASTLHALRPKQRDTEYKAQRSEAAADAGEGALVLALGALYSERLWFQITVAAVSRARIHKLYSRAYPVRVCIALGSVSLCALHQGTGFTATAAARTRF